jgi:transcriptional regulator ATRX
VLFIILQGNSSVWIKDEDYMRLDGSTLAHHRKRMTEAFNNPRKPRLSLLLISTKAGGLGINLEAANRVVIFDASWNPSHDVQSIFRVYRFGQERNVYVYRFLAQVLGFVRHTNIPVISLLSVDPI